jgi:predicted Zn-dependent protease
MKEDTFISSMLRAWEWVRGHERVLFIGLIAVVVVVALGAWGAYARRQSRERAAAKFADAVMIFRTGDLKTAEDLFAMIVDQHRGTREAAYAEYFSGKCALESGRSLDAAQAFDRYLARAGKHPFFRDAAMEGKAVALSNEHKYQEAADTYLALAAKTKTNDFMKATYLRRAAANLRLANQTQRAIELLSDLLESSTGAERRDIEIELEILKG